MPLLEPVSGGPEPWLSGRFATLEAVPRMVCCSLELSLADLDKWIAPLREQDVWAVTCAGTVGFQLRHLAGSTERLLTYAKGGALTPEQITSMKAESVPGAPLAELLAGVRAAYEAVAEFAHTAPESAAPRFIGRARMETTLGVLLAHIAEHAQRHTGQAIVIAKAATAPGPEPRPE